MARADDSRPGYCRLPHGRCRRGRVYSAHLGRGRQGPAPGVKKAPGTPVKKVRTLGLDRPWQSAAVSKIGLKDDCDFPLRGGHGNAPRKSLPAAFPQLKSAAKPRGAGKSLLDQCNSDSEGEEESPSGRKNGKYATASLGLGHPPPLPPGAASVTGKGNPPLFLQKGRWLSRRSSSGQFSTISSGSESTSQANTPTRAKGNGESIRVSAFRYGRANR